MATIDFPTILGIPTVDSYGYQDQDVEIVTTAMESGGIRRRQRSKNIPSNFIFTYIFNDEQLGVFEYFNQIILDSLTLRFNIFLKTGNQTAYYNVKYAETPRVKKIGVVFQVSCNVEASSRPQSNRFLSQYLAHDLP